MTLVFFDGFETYGIGSTPEGVGTLYPALQDVYMADDNNDMLSVESGVAASDRITDGQLLVIASGAADSDTQTTRTWRLPLAGLSNQDDWIVGAAFRFPDGGHSGTGKFTHLFDFSGHCTLRVNENGDLLLQRIKSPNPSVTIDSAAGVVTFTQWSYIEAHIKFHPTAGEYEVRIDGRTVMSGTGANTSEAGETRPFILQGGHIQNKRMQMDDFYICDDQGSRHNTFLNPDTTQGGNIFVQRVRPNAIGDFSQLTASGGGANWLDVDEDAEDDDTTYVEGESGKDLYNYEDIGQDTSVAIIAVIAKPVLKKTDAGERTYKLLAKSDGTEAASAERYPSVSYIRQSYLWPTDPATSSEWTVEAFNAAQFGVEVVPIAAPEPPAASLLLDDVAGATVALSVRKLSSSYAGSAIEVRRSSDDTLQDIGFDANGDLDTAALSSFAGSGDAFIRTWYDQSGNGGNLTQTTNADQPKIVDAGTVLKDRKDRPHIRFDGSILTGTTAPVSNQNLTALFRQQCDYNEDAKLLLGYGADTNTTHNLHIVMGDDTAHVIKIGDGSSGTGLGDFDHMLQPAWPTIQIMEFSGQNARFWRNLWLAQEKSHTEGESTRTDCIIDYTGFISEVVLYPVLSEANRNTAYDNLNAYYQTGPVRSSINAAALMPQRWKWHVDLYNWLKNITQAEVETSPADFAWDETYPDSETLSRLWITMKGGQREYREDNRIVRSTSDWWVLDNLAGKGIEATGTVKLFRWPAAAAFYYSQHLSNGGSEGNPYFDDPGVAMRALICAAVDMMMHDELQDRSHFRSKTDFAGGSMNGWMWGYQVCKDLIPGNVQEAFKAGFAYMAWKLSVFVPHDINGNMDTKAVAAVSNAYLALGDPVEKQFCIDAAKHILFGEYDGTPDTSNYKVGLYRRAGYIDEGDSPEASYNGVSLFYCTEAHARTRGIAAWSFMDTVVESMVEFKVYQYFPDPDGFWDGPTGYCSRTGESYVFDQRNLFWRDITAADTVSAGQPLIRDTRRLSKDAPNDIKDEAGMVVDIQTDINGFNNRGDVGLVYTDDAPNWFQEHWPHDNVYIPADGWWSRLRAAGTPLFPWEGTTTFDTNFDEEFWIYKDNDGTQDFGFMVETLRDPGHYGGWFGGALQCFWTRNSGMTILTRHDKTGDNISQNENTRVWSLIDTWATHHIWGRDENALAWSTSCTEDRHHPVTYEVGGVQVGTQLGAGDQKGLEAAGVLTGTVNFTNHFQALANGLRVTHTITSDGTDQITEFWVTLPMFLREAVHQSEFSDGTIEYWDGASWQELTTTLTSTTKLRLGRDFGSPRYIYISLGSSKTVKLSEDVWQQTYQADNRMRNIHIDLHGSTGTPISFPLSTTLQFDILTTDP